MKTMYLYFTKEQQSIFLDCAEKIVDYYNLYCTDDLEKAVLIAMQHAVNNINSGGVNHG